MKKEHCIKCNFSNLTFKSKNILQKHEQLSHVKNPHAIENMFKCNFCDIICSEENILMKHIKRSIRVDATNASELLKIKSQRILMHGIIIQNYDDEYSLKLCGALNTTVVASSSLEMGTGQSRDLFQ